MTETIFGLISDYGVYVIFASAFLSCLALPVPTSLMMLSGGAFAAAGDLTLWQVVVGAFAGAVLGDQTGYFIGRTGGQPLSEKLANRPSRKAVLDRARALVDKRGGTGVFLSTWAVAPLGPWVNFIAGTTGLSWARFTVADVIGEMVWVALYVGLGLAFASQIDTIATVAGNLVGLIAALVVAGGALWWAVGVAKARAANTKRPRVDTPPTA